MRNPKTGMNVRMKPEKAAERGVLPPELAESLKSGKFEVLKLQTENKTGRPSALLKMPEGVGEQQNVDGRKLWAWYVFNDDIMEEEPEKGKPEVVSDPTKIKAGDVVKTTNYSELGYSEAQNKEFRVLGIDGDRYLIIEALEGKGDLRSVCGTNTWRMTRATAILVKEYKFATGQYVKIKAEKLAEVSGKLNANDQLHGYKILEIRGTKAVVEVPPTRGVGYNDAKHPGKLVLELDLSKFEAAPPLKVRRGDKIKIKPDYIPARIPNRQKRQRMEVVEVLGDFNGFEYNVKLPDGSTVRVNENKVILPNKEAAVGSKFKKGMKVKVQEDYRSAELPESLSESARSKAFEVLEADEYNDTVLVKMPKNCDECEWDEDRNCRVWYVGKAYLEDNMTKRGSNNGGSERSEMGFGERLAANAEKGAIKTVGRKLTKAVKSGILRALEAGAKADKMDDSQIASGLAMFTRFMETEFGNAMVSAAIGMAIQQAAPQLANYIEAFADDRVQDLADEMQSDGVATVMESIIDVALEHILPEVGEVLKGLPPKKSSKKVRVATETAASKKKKKETISVGKHEVEIETDEDDEEEEEIKVPAKHSRAG